MTLLRPYRHGNGSSSWGATAVFSLGASLSLWEKGRRQGRWGLPKWSKWRGKPCWCEPFPLGEDRTASPEMLWQTVTAHNNPIV
ncbi:hypothetical protein [Nostoc sp.]|uniref:hypothetical protein n=1 Tax=Nostoc sp. TaxID=1180 RepID=UPI002FF4A370